MEKLFELGFVKSAEFNLSNQTLDFNAVKNENSKNILYAFASIGGEQDYVFYIGHTRKTFLNRMNGYRLGNGDNTNNRIHNFIKEQIISEKKIEVFVLNNVLNLSLRELDIDIAAGLEYSLISYYSLFNSENNLPDLLNRAGNYKKVILSTSDVTEDSEENMVYDEKVPISRINNVSFEYALSTNTYWDTTNINIPTNLQNYFGDHNDEVIVDFIKNKELINSLNVLINRKAVANGSPRLYFKGIDGKWVQNWKHSNFDRNTVLTINIVGKNHIEIAG